MNRNRPNQTEVSASPAAALIAAYRALGGKLAIIPADAGATAGMFGILYPPGGPGGPGGPGAPGVPELLDQIEPRSKMTAAVIAELKRERRAASPPHARLTNG